MPKKVPSRPTKRKRASVSSNTTGVSPDCKEAKGPKKKLSNEGGKRRSKENAKKDGEKKKKSKESRRLSGQGQVAKKESSTQQQPSAEKPGKPGKDSKQMSISISPALPPPEVSQTLPPPPAAPPIDLTPHDMNEIKSEKDTEVEASSASAISYKPPPMKLLPPTGHEVMHRRMVFMCAGETDGVGLTKTSEETITKAAQMLSKLSLFYYNIFVAPTLASLKTARLAASILGPDSIHMRNFLIEPGLCDVFDNKKNTILDDDPTAPADQQTSAQVRGEAYEMVATRNDVRAETTRDAFERRIASAVSHICHYTKANVLVVLEAGPLDAACRALTCLPPLTVSEGSYAVAPETVPVETDETAVEVG
ncbi:unnamed protein product, partial [Mesorhabditis spiculigera]